MSLITLFILGLVAGMVMEAFAAERARRADADLRHAAVAYCDRFGVVVDIFPYHQRPAAYPIPTGGSEVLLTHQDLIEEYRHHANNCD